MIENNGTIIAVLAYGLDMIYTKINSGLAGENLKNDGILLSECPIGTPPDKLRFDERKRIIAGLAKSTIVFESKEKIAYSKMY